MTENEAIKQLQVGYLGDTEDLVQAKHIAIKALEEIQQYRAIGTVGEFKQAMNFKKYFMELYGEGLEVANWHKNGDLEPLVNFIDEACNWLEMKGEEYEKI